MALDNGQLVLLLIQPRLGEGVARRSSNLAGRRILPHGFKQNDRHRRRKIQAARTMHRNSQRPFHIRRQQRLWETFCLAPKDQKISRPEPRSVIRA